MADRLTSSERRELRAAGKEVPPTPEPPTESDEDDAKDNQDEVESKSSQEKDKGKGKEKDDAEEAAGPSKKDKAAELNDDDEHVEVTSSEIFAGCESLDKACKSL